MENKEGIWMHGTHRRATGAPPATQMPMGLMIFSQCEENMQKLVKSAKMQNTREGELPGSPKGVPRKKQGGPNGAK